jgi:geranylgeranylglycerol-phosphate geranylgeranyltransferase
MNSSRYRTLFAAASSYLDWFRRGQRPLLMVPVGAFVSEIAWAVRPHFFALPMLAALAGVARAPMFSPRTVIAVAAAGLGWGVGQLLNDLLDFETDAVMAKDRAIVSGRLPAGPTLLFAAVLGIALTFAMLAVHGFAWVLAAAAAFLIVVYNAAKRYPLAGNVAHGALVAVVAAIGNAAVLPAAFGGWAFARALGSAWPTLATVAAVAIFYIQSNYEKDRAGDRVAGYRTLAVVLGVRASALLRASGIAAIAVAAARAGLLPDALSRATMAIAVILGLGSTLRPICSGTDAAALGAYRLAVHCSALAMLSLGAGALGIAGTAAAALLTVSLTEWAFGRTPNP